MIDSSEFIACDFYEQLVKELDDKRIVHVMPEDISTFFENTSDDKKLTVVTSYCDYSIRYQSPNHPNKDMIKHASALNWEAIGNVTNKYAAVQIGPACNQDKCNVADKYAVKIDRHTISTFSRIPAGVRWFCANLDIENPQATWLPFGVSNHWHGLSILHNYQNRPKKGLLYVNFQNNSFDRVHYKNYFRRQPWVTFRENANLPVEQYFEELAEHEFVLSPFGNGLDCYRNHEAIYLGTVPVVESSFIASHMKRSGMPVLPIDDFMKLHTGELGYERYSPEVFNCAALKKSHWRNKIRG